MGKTLRPHQSACVESFFDYLKHGRGTKPLLVCPVGFGKTLVIAELIKRIHQQAPRTKIVVLTSTRELLVQNMEELKLHYPDVDACFYCAGLGQKRLHSDVVLASIQSIYDKVLKFNRAPQIIFCDESHTISHDDDTTYRRFLADCEKLNDKLVICGLTGSPWRMTTGRLDEGEGRLFDGTAYEMNIAELIDKGFLCRPITPKMQTRLSVDGVAIKNGDYVEKQLQEAVDIDDVTRACVAEMLQHGASRKKWLIFTAGITHAEHVRDALRAVGISAEMVLGKTPKDERNSIFSRFRRGDFRALVNVATATTGVNITDIDLIAFMRPTRSAVLYVQMLGRGLRIAEGKENLLLLDFGGVVNELGPVDAIEVRKRPSGNSKDEGEPLEAAPFKRCPSCGNLCVPSQRVCFNCSYSFITDKLNQRASEKAVISTDEAPEDYQVLSVSVKRHLKAGDGERELEGLEPLNPATLKVTYATMAGAFHEWVCFEHHKYEVGDSRRFAWDKAVAWHKQRIPDLKPPITIKEALAMGYTNYAPFSIKVRKEGKYNRIIGYDFSRLAEPEKPPPVSEWGDDIPF